MKVKLRSFDTVIYTDEHIQEVRYLYSIEDSSGLIEINLTIPEESEPVEQFVLYMKDLYRGFREYIVYHGKYKYRLDLDKSRTSEGTYITKIKMY